MSTFDHASIEKKWSLKWKTDKTYQPDLENAKKPFYNLMMFPYPSAEGLHVGNTYAFTGADVYGRFQRMKGFDVFEPIGLDGFGIHSENYALKIGKHPKEQAKISQNHFYEQLHAIGNGFAWDNKLETYDPDYYKWTQWLFVQMFKHGLAYRKKAMVNWCPSCKTVLADEQVEAGVCERCKSTVERKAMEQWFFKITDYADKLLSGIETIDWPQKIKIAQRQWIGKSKGLSIDFFCKAIDKNLTIWTKFWETVFGVTFLVIAPEHPLVKQLITKITDSKKKQDVENYVSNALQKSEQQRKLEEKDKSGIYTGLTCMNPVNGEEVPIWIADYVLMDVGTGVVMGVPAHDERDFVFAKKYKLPIKQVVSYEDKKIDQLVNEGKQSFEGAGKLVNSGQFNGEDAWGFGKEKMASWMIEKEYAKWEVNYHLRDWLISRQRYWGPPIPMVFCEKCQWQAVAEKDLPVLLPDVTDWKPKGTVKGPLENAPKEWLYTKCPKCGGEAKRETDVSDTFLDSSWYFLRYPSINSKNQLPNSKQISNSKSQISNDLVIDHWNLDVPWNSEITRRWLPVNVYIGGAEHAVLHLLYSRFVWMALKDWGHLNDIGGDEPFPFLFSHGLIVKDGAKMSKSRGNVVIPDEYIKQFGADTLRMYLMFLGPYDMGGDFRDSGMIGMRKFLERVVTLLHDSKKVTGKTSPNTLKKLHKTIKDMDADLGEFRYNTAIARFMELMNVIKADGETISKEDAKLMVKLIAPFAPFIAEELWEYFCGITSVHTEPYPKCNVSFIEEQILTIVIQINGKLKDTLVIPKEESDTEDIIIEKALEKEKVKKSLEGKKPKNTIFVSGRLVNFVV